MHADALRTELVSEIAAAGFERRLHRTHDAVRGHDLVGAVVAHREHGAAVLHERRRELGHAHEGMARHVHRLGEPAGGAIEESALQVFLRRERDRVHEHVEAAPLARNFVEHGFELPGHGHVERQEELGRQLARKRLDIGTRLLVEIGDADVRTELAERACATIGDRLVVGDADDEGLASLQHLAWLVVAHACFLFTDSWLARRPARRSRPRSPRAHRAPTRRARSPRARHARPRT